MRCLISKAIVLSAISMVAVFFFLAKAQAEEVLGYWQFEEGSGGNVMDTSGMGNDGATVGDVEWTEGRFGGGLLVDGLAGWVAVPNEGISASLLSANALTMAAWLKPVRFDPDAIQVHSDGANYFLRVINNSVDPGLNIGGWKEVRTGNTPINQGEWYHVAATYDGETLSAFLNGELDDITDAGSPLPAGGELFLGTAGWAPGGGYGAGVLDEVLIADYAFTDAELSELMGSGLPGAAVKPAGKLSTTWCRVKAGY